MQRRSFEGMACPIARSLERIGEWGFLILRDAAAGLTRFDEFRTALGIAPAVLSRHLDALVEAGLLERRLYAERPPRHAYHLTPRGLDFRPVLVALLAWGNRHLPPEGQSVRLVDAETGEVVEPVLVDRRTGLPIAAPRHALVPGPAASDRMRRRLARGGGLLPASDAAGAVADDTGAAP